MLDTPRLLSRPRRGPRGVLLADFTTPGPAHGLEQFVAHPELQHAGGDQDVAGAPCVVLAHTDLLPADAHNSVGGDAPGDPLFARPLRRRSWTAVRLTAQLEATGWRGVAK